MDGVSIRPAVPGDLARITEIYNAYVIDTAITFDVAPYTVEARREWLAQFDTTGPYRLLVACAGERLVGYAGTMRFRPKAAYHTSVETTIYLEPGAQRRGLGARLYAALFDALSGENVHRAYAGVTLPNDGSVALHERMGFTRVGVYTEVGHKLERYWDVLWLEKKLG